MKPWRYREKLHLQVYFVKHVLTLVKLFLTGAQSILYIDWRQKQTAYIYHGRTVMQSNDLFRKLADKFDTGQVVGAPLTPSLLKILMLLLLAQKTP